MRCSLMAHEFKGEVGSSSASGKIKEPHLTALHHYSIDCNSGIIQN